MQTISQQIINLNIEGKKKEARKLANKFLNK